MKFEDIERKEMKSLGMPLVQYKANHVQAPKASKMGANGRHFTKSYVNLTFATKGAHKRF